MSTPESQNSYPDSPLIERLAREAGFIRAADERGNPYETFDVWPDDVHRFAALVAEECAKLCEADDEPGDDGDDCSNGWDAGRKSAAAAIRAKFALDSRQPTERT